MDEFSTTRPPKTTQGTYGTIDDFGGGGKTYSDPRDNPNYQATVPQDTAGGTPTTEEKKRYSRNSSGDKQQGYNYMRNGVRYNSITGAYPTEPKSVEDIQADMTMAAQGEINALNDYYKSMLAEQATINQKNERSTAAISTLTGLAGSTEADIQQQKTTAAGQKANQAIIRENMLQVQSVLGNIRKSAVEEARSQRLEARQSEQDRIALRKAKKEEMDENIKTLAAAGVTLDGLKTGDKQTYDYLVKEYGSEDILKGAFVLNTPQDQIIDKKLQGGKYMIARQNPTTGKISIETMETGLPPEYNDITKIGGKYVAVPTGWDGDMAKLRTVGYEPTESTPGGIFDKLDFRTANAVMSQADKFGTSDVVKRYNNIIAASNLIYSADPNSKNPATHQAIVYNFAKALDPDSVVREGEYATIKKYSQSLVDKYKGEINQAINGSGFLSPAAIQAIKEETANRISAYEPQYQNLKQETANRINNIAGADVADIVLLDYEQGYSGNQPSKVLTNPSTGEQFDASDLTEEEYNQALQDGYVAQ